MSNVQNPVVSVIVPARNEEACLSLCLESLVAQTGIDFEIIVVDDASTDRTAEIARSFAVAATTELRAAKPGTTGTGTGSTRADQDFTTENDGTAESRALTVREGQSISRNCLAVTVISAPPLPENWTGKNNAMSAGAKVAHIKTKWLLFTDSDTVHKPGSLARAVAEAEEHGAALLSYSPEQEVCTFWEKAVMPVIFAELAATYPPQKVNDPASPIAAANGQYLMISRETYDAVGGHTRIASDILEDVAMARLVKSSGRRIFFRYGGDAVRTRMYHSWAQMKEGWTKNLALLFERPRMLGFLRGIEFDAIGLAIISAVALPYFGLRAMALVFSAVAVVLITNFGLRVRRAHFPITSNLLALGGLMVFSRLLFRSAKLHGDQGVIWKGRRYRHTQKEWLSYLSTGAIASESFMEGVEDLPTEHREP